MATGSLTIKDVRHSYDGTAALKGVSLTIEEGEFVTLLGPSGCGKTTLLRIVAGFIQPTAGQVLLQERDITHVPPHGRPLNMVFQRPTLFPHLNVFDNVAFGLRIAHVPKREIADRVADALELVRLPGMASRRAGELSGGQMQRVALARALVNRPRVLLLDEPLSALDLKIRLEMEIELRRMHRETGATFIYVTHDQREALALSDRIAVFSQGRIEQVAAPADLYARPATPFTARFVGDANVLAVDVGADGGETGVVRIGSTRLGSGYAGEVRGPAWLVLRPECLRFGERDGRASLRGVVRDVAFRGTGSTYRIEVPGIAEELKAEVPFDAGAGPRLGDDVTVTWEMDSCWLIGRDDASQGGPGAPVGHADRVAIDA